MTPNGSPAALDFAEARLFVARAENLHQRQAVRRVAEHAREASDFGELLSMPVLANLPAPHTTPSSPDAIDVFRTAAGARA